MTMGPQLPNSLLRRAGPPVGGTFLLEISVKSRSLLGWEEQADAAS